MWRIDDDIPTNYERTRRAHVLGGMNVRGKTRECVQRSNNSKDESGLNEEIPGRAKHFNDSSDLAKLLENILRKYSSTDLQNCLPRFSLRAFAKLNDIKIRKIYDSRINIGKPRFDLIFPLFRFNA